MTSNRLAVGIVGCALLAAACAQVPLAESASGAPATPASETQHAVAGPVGLDAPARRHVRPELPSPSGNVTFVDREALAGHSATVARPRRVP